MKMKEEGVEEGVLKILMLMMIMMVVGALALQVLMVFAHCYDGHQQKVVGQISCSLVGVPWLDGLGSSFLVLRVVERVANYYNFH